MLDLNHFWAAPTAYSKWKIENEKMAGPVKFETDFLSHLSLKEEEQYFLSALHGRWRKQYISYSHTVKTPYSR